ncbi:esterase/lipase family protein [Cellulomonas oligotrophica]|uniref:Alpha/beta hydrolase n=1 Tax=Cellulomonas oligotrophica TaxID=931536 RepID=A0A7Y9FIF6_9CELL|nr:alpha/beta hydrolase [Cellulomonas oligotrophica]NYD87894.1 hypothetical protein [Cellulomonas oligotrophica]GIG32899.1 hypothetical protein Col01nite_20580 [Cellulomonas oligotrophica]
MGRTWGAAGAGRAAARAREVAGRAAAWGRDYAWIAGAQGRAVLRPPDPRALASGHRAPVVLLPGIYETWPVMATLARALHAAGHPVHVVPALGRNHRPLDASARLVARRMASLDLTGAVLVAHSKGGLIGKLVLGLPAGAPAADGTRTGRAVGLVAVNTPFAGSAYARWFPVRAVRALSPGDRQVLALAREVAVHARVWSVHARFDPHVPAGSWLAGAVNVRLPLDGHFRVLDDPRVHAVVLDAVEQLAAPREGPPDEPAPGR